MNNEVTEEEAFEYYLKNFLRSLEYLQLEPAEMCKRWGDFNVAGELVYDFRVDGGQIITMGCSYLSEMQKLKVNEFLESLDGVPNSVTHICDNFEDNVQAMSHPCWESYRLSAKALFEILGSVSIKNKEYFANL